MSHNPSGGSLISKIGSYLQIVSKDPRSTAFVPLAEAYRQIGLLDDALEAARMGTRSLPHFSPGFSTLGRILGQMGRIDEAMSAFAKALDIDRQSQAALVGLARLHLVRGERDEARKILKKAAALHPQDENVRNMLIALDLARPWDRLKGGQEETTEPALQQTAESTLADESASIYTPTLAEIYVKQGLTDKAVGVYEEILRQDPDNSSARTRLQELRASTEPAEATPAACIDDEFGAEAVDFTEEDMAEQGELPVSQAAPRVRGPLATLERWLAGIQQRRVHVR